MRMAAEAENALSDQLEDICRKSSKAGGHLSLDKWEIEETDLIEFKEKTPEDEIRIGKKKKE